jgi:hypothetical protein
MRRTIALVGRELSELSALAIGIGPAVGSIVLIQAPNPVSRLTESPLPEDAAAIIFLDGTENVGDLLGLLKANPNLPLLLLTPEFPPHASTARLVAQHGGTFLPADESPVVITATLVALLSRPGVAAV